MLSSDVIDDIVNESVDYYTTYRKRLAGAILLLPNTISFDINNTDNRFSCFFYETETVCNWKKRLLNELEIVDSCLLKLGVKTVLEDLNETVISVLKVFTDNGLWEAGAELVGSWCFNVYQNYLAVERFPLRTTDIDIAVPLPYNGAALDLGELLKELGLAERFYSNGVVFYEGNALRVEFLVPEKGRGSDSGKILIKELSISAQPLRFLDILISFPFFLDVRGAGQVKIPMPAAFAMHKLLIAPRRKGRGKSEKDYLQAYYVMKMLFRNIDYYRADIEMVIKRLHPRWIESIKESIQNMKKCVPLLEEETAERVEAFFSQEILKV